MALDRLTKVDGGGISTTSNYRVGIITATKFVGPIEGSVTGSITATDGTFSGDVSIGGTLTYEDVTNIDSVGIITARDGIHITGDNKYLKIGAGNDLQLVHTGGETYIANSTGHLTHRSDVHKWENLAGSSEYLRIDSNGDVGINNTNPTAKLDIVEATSIAAVKIKSGTSTNQNASLTFSNDNGGGLMHLGVFGSSATTFGANEANDGFITAMQQLSINSQNDSGEIRFGIGSTPNTKLLISSAGKVGISSNNPTSLLTVGARPNAARSSHPTALISPTSGNASLMLRGNSPTIDFDSTAGGIAQVCTDNADLIVSAGTFENTALNSGEIIRIKSDGRVGIKTTAPQAKLELDGRFRILDNSDGTPSTGKGLEISYYTSDDMADILSYDRGAGQYKKLQLRGSSVEIKKNNSVLINAGVGGNGVTVGFSTTNALVTNGEIIATRGYSSFKSPSASYAAIYVASEGNTNDTANQLLMWNAGGANRGGIGYVPNTGELRMNNQYFFTFCTGSSIMGGTERLRITSDGKVGINQQSPTAMLQVDYDEGNSEVGLRLRAYNASNSKTWQLSEINGTPGVFTIRNSTNNQNILNIDGIDQRIGVNNTSPDSALSIAGTGSDAATRITIKDGVGIAEVNGRYGNLVFDTDRDNAINGSVMVFQIDGNEAFRVDSNRQIGIGTITPGGDLHIYDGDSSARIYITSDNDEDSSIYFGRVNDTATAAIRYEHSSNSLDFYGYNNSKRLTITSTGAIKLNDNNIELTGAGGNVTTAYNNAGWEKLVFDASYNTNPVGPNKIILQNDPGGGGWFAGFGIAANELSIYSGGNTVFYRGFNNASAINESLRINSDGRVGINTNTDSMAGVTGNLNIANTNFNNHTVINLSRNTTADRPQIRFQNTNGNIGYIGTYGSDLVLSSGNDLIFRASSTDKLRISSNGQLLHGNYSEDQGWAVFWRAASSGADAGTAGQDGAGHQGVNIRSDMGPTHLDLTGTDNFTLKLSNQAYAGSGIGNPQGTISKILFNTVTYNGWNSYGAICLESQGTSAAKGQMVFMLNDGTSSMNEKLRIKSNEMDTASGQGLNIYGQNVNHTNDAVLCADKTGNADWCIQARSIGNDYGMYARVGNGAAYALAVYDSDNSTFRFRVRGDGVLFASNTTIQSLSDARLKENIVDANSQWDDIKALRFRNFNWKSDSGYDDGKTMLGLIAQEVEPISPNLIDLDAQTKEDIENGVPDPEYKSVKYSIVWMKAVKALQEAQARIEQLESEVAALKGT